MEIFDLCALNSDCPSQYQRCPLMRRSKRKDLPTPTIEEIMMICPAAEQFDDPSVLPFGCELSCAMEELYLESENTRKKESKSMAKYIRHIEQTAEEDFDPINKWVDDIFDERLEAALNQLSLVQCTRLMLHVVYDYRVEYIARCEGVDPSTIWRMEKRTLQKLRNLLKK